MSSTPVHGDGNRHLSLSMMPPEVATNIFCQLPSFSDVFALSAACCRLRHLWLKSVNPIYNQIAPRSIPCERAARRFLVDQDGSDLGTRVSANDVVRMLRNAGVIETAILQFEREIVSRVRSKSDSDVRIVRHVGLMFTRNSGWLVSRGILWVGRAQASSDPDSYRTDTLHSFLLLPLESNEA